MKKINVSKSVLRQYINMRKVIPAYRRSVERNILVNRGIYVNKLLKSIKGKNVKQAKKIIKDFEDEKHFNKLYRDLYKTLGFTIAQSQNRILNNTKAENNVLEERWLKLLNDYAKEYSGLQIVTLTATLKSKLLDSLDKIIANAVEQGIGIEKITDDIIKEVKGAYTAESRWMARRIAHTETMKCSSKAQIISVDSLNVRYWKIWQITGIRTRDQHLIMSGRAVKDNQAFILPNGDRMMMPQDDSMGASAGNIVNCSCFLVFQPMKV